MRRSIDKLEGMNVQINGDLLIIKFSNEKGYYIAFFVWEF